MIELNHLNIGYHQPLLAQPASFVIPAGLNVLIGRNGMGKTTLLKTLSGHLKPLQGTCSVNGQNVHRLSARQRASQISIVTTERIRLAYLKVREVLELGRFPHSNFMGQLSEADKAMITATIRQLNIQHLENKEVGQLSDGELQQVLIGRAMIQDTPIIMLDEPTTHLDLVNRFLIFKRLKSLAKEQKKTIILSTHEVELALQIADNTLLINEKGQLKAAPVTSMINDVKCTFEEEGVVFDELTLRFRIEET